MIMIINCNIKMNLDKLSGAMVIEKRVFDKQSGYQDAEYRGCNRIVIRESGEDTERVARFTPSLWTIKKKENRGIGLNHSIHLRTKEPQ